MRFSDFNTVIPDITDREYRFIDTPVPSKAADKEAFVFPLPNEGIYFLFDENKTLFYVSTSVQMRGELMTQLRKKRVHYMGYIECKDEARKWLIKRLFLWMPESVNVRDIQGRKVNIISDKRNKSKSN